MAITEDKIKHLEDWGISRELIDQIQAFNSQKAAQLDDDAVESKEISEDTSEKDSAVDVAETDAEESEAVDDAPAQDNSELLGAVMDTMAAVTAIGERVKSLEAIVKELSKKDSDKVAQKVKETPLASLTELMRKTVIGDDDTKVDGRTKLGKSGPDEVEPQTEQRWGIPFIDNWVTNADQKNR